MTALAVITAGDILAALVFDRLRERLEYVAAPNTSSSDFYRGRDGGPELSAAVDALTRKASQPRQSPWGSAMAGPGWFQAGVALRFKGCVSLGGRLKLPSFDRFVIDGRVRDGISVGYSTPGNGTPGSGPRLDNPKMLRHIIGLLESA